MFLQLIIGKRQREGEGGREENTSAGLVISTASVRTLVSYLSLSTVVYCTVVSEEDEKRRRICLARFDPSRVESSCVRRAQTRMKLH